MNAVTRKSLKQQITSSDTVEEADKILCMMVGTELETTLEKTGFLRGMFGLKRIEPSPTCDEELIYRMSLYAAINSIADD